MLELKSLKLREMYVTYPANGTGWFKISFKVKSIPVSLTENYLVPDFWHSTLRYTDESDATYVSVLNLAT